MTISSSSYAIVFPQTRTLTIVNARLVDHVNEVMLINWDSRPRNAATLTTKDDQDIDINSLLSDGGPPYKTSWMKFTTKHDGSVATARYVSDQDQMLDDESINHESAMKLARMILWYEAFRASGFSEEKTFEHSIKVCGLSKEKLQDGEICVVCQEEYKSNEMIGTLECKHTYHEMCIKKWLLRNYICPICKTMVLDYEPV